MLSRLCVTLALHFAALLFLSTPARAAYYAFYADYTDYGIPACNATSAYDYEEAPLDLTDSSIVPPGFLPIIRTTINATECPEAEYCYGPVNSGTVFNVTAFVQCSLVEGSSTMYDLTVVAFEGATADAVDQMIDWTTAVETSTLSQLTAQFNVSLYASTVGAFDACVGLTECYNYMSYGSMDAGGPYPDMFCSSDLYAQFSCNAATSPPAAAVVPSDPPTGVFGDPQLYGLLGQSFQVHGIDGGVYNLISAPALQVNTRFVFLDAARCPSKQVVDTPCWSHPGSYMGALSFQVAMSSGEVVRITVAAGPMESGLQAVQVGSDAYPTGSLDLSLGASGEVRIVSRSTHTVLIHTSLFDITADNSDHFLNLRLTYNVPLSQLRQTAVHGLLGQTHTRSAQKGALKEVTGEVDDYFVVDGLHGTQFMYNRFQQA